MFSDPRTSACVQGAESAKGADPAMPPPIHTVVSRPGPVERRILERLAPIASEHRRIAAAVALRTLETEARPGGRSTMLLLHGRGHCAALWAPVIEALAPERRVIAADLPGFGHSAMSDAIVTGPEDALARFVDPIEALASNEGPLVVVGHSLGGLVALELALRGRAPVKALVLVCAMGLGPYMAPSARAYLRFGPERVARVNRVLGRSTSGLSSRVDADLSGLRSELHLGRGRGEQAKRVFDRMVPMFGPVFHRRDRLDAVEIPSLLVWGSRDDAFPLPVAIDATARIADAKLEVLETGHSPHLEDPDRVVALVRDFVSARGL